MKTRGGLRLDRAGFGILMSKPKVFKFQPGMARELRAPFIGEVIR
jgi:hypothetical protein